MKTSEFSKETPYQVDRPELEKKVKSVYTAVATKPGGEYHFELGRPLALKLGYSSDQLDSVPRESVDSFAGVGYTFGFAGIRPGEVVLDLGSGAGMDAFLASNYCGNSGKVVGLDMTTAQLQKAKRLAEANGISNVSFIKGYVEELFFEDASFDVIISNGVINLSPEKEKVFRQVARVLKPGGRLAVSDIVSELPLPETVVCDASLWASCIGGATQQDRYRALIEASGLRIERWVVNEQYGFLSKGARSASLKYGVKSVSLLAVKV